MRTREDVIQEAGQAILQACRALAPDLHWHASTIGCPKGISGTNHRPHGPSHVRVLVEPMGEGVESYDRINVVVYIGDASTRQSTDSDELRHVLRERLRTLASDLRLGAVLAEGLIARIPAAE